jgi:hypothetical protein
MLKPVFICFSSKPLQRTPWRISGMGRGDKNHNLGTGKEETLMRTANICEGLVTLAFTYVTGMAGIVTGSRPCLCRRTFSVTFRNATISGENPGFWIAEIAELWR